MFDTQKQETLTKFGEQLDRIMDHDDHKEIEIKEAPKFPHEKYFKQQLADWEEERTKARIAAEQEAARQVKLESDKIVNA